MDTAVLGNHLATEVPTDIADAVAVDAAADRVERELGAIDVCANNAMTTQQTPEPEDPDRPMSVREAILVVDVISDFGHADGHRLLASLRERVGGLDAALCAAHRRGLLVVYANDAHGVWDGDAPAAVRRALDGPGGDVIAQVAPRPGDLFLFKDGYAALGGTPLEGLLREHGIERIVLVGAATEMCIAQTAITAREKGFQVTVLRDACACVDEEDERIALAYLARVSGSRVARVEEWEPQSAATQE